MVKDACGSLTNTMHKVVVLDMANWLFGGRILNAGELAKTVKGKNYNVWEFKKPATFDYELDTVESMYALLDD